MKKPIVTFGITLSIAAVTYFSVNQNEFVPAPLVFNGEVIEMTHTDDNQKEDLIIYTDKATYSSWDKTDVIFSVTNLSNKDQQVTSRLLFGKNEQTAEVKEFFPQVPYIITVEDFEEKETCELIFDAVFKKPTEVCSKKKIGEHEETRYKDMWVSMSHVKGEKPSDYDNQEKISKVIDSKYKTDHESTTWIASGETRYFKAVILFSPKSPTTEFYIEATGDQGSYGLLDPWYSGSWTYRKQIDINPNYVSGSADLTNFPYMINDTFSVLQASAQADGDDILFTSSDGTTKLDHEIETYTSATGQLIAHVRIPTLSYNATTTIYMYYGNSAASNQQNSTGVWDTNYKAVFHLKDGTTLSGADSTSNANTGTLNNTPTAVAGKIDGAASFASASDESLSTASNTNLSLAAVTYSAWVNATSFPNGYNAVISRIFGSPEYTQLFVLSSGKLAVYFRGTADVSYDGTGATTLSTGTWYYITVTYSSTDGMRSYVNASSDKTVAANGVLATGNNASLSVADDLNTGSRNFNGVIDEVRISNVVRSADWIATEYNNQSATSTFQIYGTPQTVDIAPYGVVGTSPTINYINLSGTLLSHTVESNSNTLLICSVGIRNNSSQSISTMTFNGDSLTKYAEIATTAGDGVRNELWYLVNPDVTTANVLVTTVGESYMFGTCQNFRGVDQTTPLGTAVTQFTTTASPSLSVTSATGELVYAFLFSDTDVSHTPGSGETQKSNYSGYPAINRWRTSSYIEDGASSVTMSPTLGASDLMSFIGVSIKPVSSTPAPSGAVPSNIILFE